MPVEFWDSATEIVHDDFQEWRARHADGYVVNVKSPTNAMLHRAMCHHFEGVERRQADALDWVLTGTRKVCSADVEALRRWAETSEPAVTLENCRCLRNP